MKAVNITYMETEKISIPKEHLSFLIPSYQKKLLELKAELNRLVEEISSIDLVLKSINDKNIDLGTVAQKTEEQTLPDNKIEPHIGSEVYNKNWSWIKKITFCLETYRKPLSTGDIFKFIQENEPNLFKKVRNISAVISANVSSPNGTLYRLQQDEGKILYGLKKWQKET